MAVFVGLAMEERHSKEGQSGNIVRNRRIKEGKRDCYALEIGNDKGSMPQINDSTHASKSTYCDDSTYIDGSTCTNGSAEWLRLGEANNGTLGHLGA